MNRFLKHIAFSIIIISLTSSNMYGMQIKKFQRLLTLDKCHQRALCTKIKSDGKKLEIENPPHTYINEEKQEKTHEEFFYSNKYPKTIPYPINVKLDPEMILAPEEVSRFFKHVVESMPEE